MKIKSAIHAAVVLAAAFALTGAHAQDAAGARGMAATCFTCHGTDGNSVGGVPPGLAGQNKDYMLQQLKDFKAGKRPATVMQQHAKGYTDQQLEQIAAYFAAVKPAAPVAAPRAGN